MNTPTPPEAPPTQPEVAAPSSTPAAKHRKVSEKSNRTRAREFAVQALYQYLVGGNSPADIDLFTRDLQGFNKADSVHYDALLHGCIAQAADMDAALLPLLDRPMNEVSPIEHSILWIGGYELKHCPDVPLRVVINECIELAKSFGGTDGHKYINGVLHQLGQQWRTLEANHSPSS
jgi:transcription antitermination protein NusB